MTDFESWKADRQKKLEADLENKYNMVAARRIAQEMREGEGWTPSLIRQLCCLAHVQIMDVFDFEDAADRAAAILHVDIY